MKGEPWICDIDDNYNEGDVTVCPICENHRPFPEITPLLLNMGELDLSGVFPRPLLSSMKVRNGAPKGELKLKGEIKSQQPEYLTISESKTESDFELLPQQQVEYCITLNTNAPHNAIKDQYLFHDWLKVFSNNGDFSIIVSYKIKQIGIKFFWQWAFVNIICSILLWGGLSVILTNNQQAIDPISNLGWGFISGIGQWLLLRRKLPKSGWWIPANGIGLIIGAVVAGILLSLLIGVAKLPDLLISTLFYFITGVVLGFCQWLIIHSSVKRAGWIILSTITGQLIGLICSNYLMTLISNSLFLEYFIFYVTYSSINGMVIVLLLRDVNRPAIRPKLNTVKVKAKSWKELVFISIGTGLGYSFLGVICGGISGLIHWAIVTGPWSSDSIIVGITLGILTGIIINWSRSSFSWNLFGLFFLLGIFVNDYYPLCGVLEIGLITLFILGSVIKSAISNLRSGKFFEQTNTSRNIYYLLSLPILILGTWLIVEVSIKGTPALGALWIGTACLFLGMLSQSIILLSGVE